MSRFTQALALWISLLLIGCSPQTAIESLVPKQDRAVAIYYIDLLRAGNFQPIERDTDPSLKTGDLHAMLEKMATFFPKGTPASIKVIGINVFNTPTSSTKNITFEYEFPGSWLLVNVATRKSESQFSIVGFRVEPLTDSLENLNRFTLSGKGPGFYLVLLFAVLIPLFILFALICCIRTKVKRKWLWIVFILLGFGKFSLNWTTGQWFFNPLAFDLFGAGALAAPYGPWMISLAFPLGALLFLLLRRRISLTGREQLPS